MNIRTRLAIIFAAVSVLLPLPGVLTAVMLLVGTVKHVADEIAGPMFIGFFLGAAFGIAALILNRKDKKAIVTVLSILSLIPAIIYLIGLIPYMLYLLL